jgi:hypothetical protein
MKANPPCSVCSATCRAVTHRFTSLICQISPDSQAQVIGLREGDVLIRYASKPVDTALDLPFLTARAAGTGIELEIRRDGTPFKLNVKAGPLGMVCEDRIVARKDSP